MILKSVMVGLIAFAFAGCNRSPTHMRDVPDKCAVLPNQDAAECWVSAGKERHALTVLQGKAQKGDNEAKRAFVVNFLKSDDQEVRAQAYRYAKELAENGDKASGTDIILAALENDKVDEIYDLKCKRHVLVNSRTVSYFYAKENEFPIQNAVAFNGFVLSDVLYEKVPDEAVDNPDLTERFFAIEPKLDRDRLFSSNCQSAP